MSTSQLDSLQQMHFEKLSIVQTHRTLCNDAFMLHYPDVFLVFLCVYVFCLLLRLRLPWL